jgi:hypothetical protein
MITGQCTRWVLVGIQRNFSKNNNNYSLCSITIIPNLWNHASLGIEGPKKRVGGGGGGKTRGIRGMMRILCPGIHGYSQLQLSHFHGQRLTHNLFDANIIQGKLEHTLSTSFLALVVNLILSKVFEDMDVERKTRHVDSLLRSQHFLIKKNHPFLDECFKFDISIKLTSACNGSATYGKFKTFHIK